MKNYKIAVLDAYQNVALESADWSVLRDRADIAVFQDHLADPDAVIERLLPFDVVCVMRDRTPLSRNVIEHLPNLKLIASTGSGNASIDVDGPVDQCVVRADRRRVSFDQRVEEQANCRRGGRRIRH
jgi:phosphoglycerate dehydrogenase-like enzyme